MKGMEKAGESLFHIVLSSKTEVICRDRHDYIFFENQIGASARKSNVPVLAYAVMSNHTHIAAACTDPDGLILRIKSGYTRYFNRKYGRAGQLMTYTYCQEVRGYLRQKVMISYILRNPMHHGICETPFQYPFSSISAYFPDALSPFGTKDTRETPVDHYRKREGKKGGRESMSGRHTTSGKEAMADRYPTTTGKGAMAGKAAMAGRQAAQGKQAAEGNMKNTRPEEYCISRDGRKALKLPIDSTGRIKLDYMVNAGRVEYLFRTSRNFIHSMNRWNTEDWEREQANAKITDGIVSLETAEPTCAHLQKEMRAFENGSFIIQMTDLELCRYIDRELLPRMKIPSYILIGNDLKKEIAEMLKGRFHISTEQAMRCLGGF